MFADFSEKVPEEREKEGERMQEKRQKGLKTKEEFLKKWNRCY